MRLVKPILFVRLHSCQQHATAHSVDRDWRRPWVRCGRSASVRLGSCSRQACGHEDGIQPRHDTPRGANDAPKPQGEDDGAGNDGTAGARREPAGRHLMRFMVVLLIAAACFGQGKQNVTQTGLVDARGANWIPPTSTFASPPSSPATGSVYVFTDASTVGTCSGGGTSLATCRYSGSAWAAVAGSGGGGGGNNIRECVVMVGDPGAASAALAGDNDSPVACGNTWATDWTITSVACWANAGSPTVTPILTAGLATSILTGALTCGTAAWAAGTVQGTAPVVHSFSANGATCSSTPCTIDANITSAGGTAKYLIIRITGTI